MPITKAFSCRILLVLALLVATPLQSEDWPQWLGGADRVSARTFPLENDGQPSDDQPSDDSPSEARPGGAELLWKSDLGSGYSTVSVAAGRAVTTAAIDGSDFVTAFDTASGRALWRYRLEPTYAGHDGAVDGPLSTPVNDGSRVYALSARGRLVALEAQDGSLLWEAELGKLGAEEPYFGHSSSPLLVDDKLLVQTGGEKSAALTAFAAADGTVLWRSEAFKTRYGSPTLATLAGERQLIVTTTGAIVVFELESGATRWSYTFEGPDFTPLPLSDERIAISNDEQTHLLKIAVEEDQWTVEALWTSRDLGDPWGPVVAHENTLYGAAGGRMFGIDLATGATLWKARSAKGSLLRLGSALLMLDHKVGLLSAVDTSREAYQEIGSWEIVPPSKSLAMPTFADGRLFVRTLTEIRAYRLTPPTAAAP